MLPSMYLVVLFLLVSTVLSNDDSTGDAENYFHVIKDLQDFYSISSIVVVYEDEQNSSFINELLIRLSRVQSYSLAIRSQDFTPVYPKIIPHSKTLFTVILKTDRGLENFIAFTSKEFLSLFHVWLLWFDPSMSHWMLDFCANPRDNWLQLNYAVQMLIKCGNEPDIKEWFYTGLTNDVQVKEYLEWRQDTRLVNKKHPVLFERRRNLSGIVQRTAFVDDMSYPLERRIKDGYSFELMPKIVQEVASVMSIKLKFLQASKTYGLYNKNERRWTGILGRLQNGSLDIAATEMIVTSNRLTSFDFTTPILISRSMLFIKMPNNTDVPWNAYLKTFSKKVWMTLVAMIVVSPILLTYIKIHTNGWQHARRCSTLLDNYMHVWSIYCQQGLPDYSNCLSLKLAYLSIFLSAFLLLSVYSGSLTSYVTVSQPTMPFTTPAEFIKDGTYKLIVIKNSAEHDAFLNPTDKMFDQMSKFLKREEYLPTSYIEGFDKVCSERVAFFASMAMLDKIYRAVPCQMKAALGGRVRYMGIGLKKYDPLTNFLNYYILKLQENGVIRQIKNNYEKKFTHQKPPFDAFNIRDVTPLFAILICGYASSIILMMFETLYDNLYNKKRLKRCPGKWKNVIERF